MPPIPARPVVSFARLFRTSSSTHAFLIAIVAVANAAAANGAAAQQPLVPQPLTRSEAVARVLGRSPRGTVLAADTLAASGRLASARAYPNPTLTATYSKSAPQKHLILDVPLDLPYVRGPRVRAARAGARQAQLTFLASRAALALDADTLYTHAQGAALLARLSAAGAADALRLLQGSEARQRAGDASDLEVNLARVGWEQAANVAAADSLEALNALLDLQATLAMRSDSVAVALTDSLTAPSATPTLVQGGAVVPAAPSTSLLVVQAAGASLTAAQESLALQRAGVFGAPSIEVGVENGDPSGSEPGLLPTVGVALPIPLFNRNRGEIVAARADVQRAQAELDIARREADATLARARRTRDGALARLARDSSTVQSATRNTALTERASTEGEMAISDVLDARRAQRDAETQYVTDLVAARVSDAVIRVLTSPPPAQ